MSSYKKPMAKTGKITMSDSEACNSWKMYKHMYKLHDFYKGGGQYNKYAVAQKSSLE